MSDNPAATHEQYDEMLPTWKACRDANTGQRAIHAAGETYLPKLTGQQQNDYDAYVKRAMFYNATCRTVEAMRGLVFSSDPSVELPESIKSWEDDITLTGISLDGFARSVFDNTMITGRHGILVEHPQSNGTAITSAQAAELEIRPYFVEYTAENILNWGSSRVNNIWKLSYVALSEVSDDGEPQVRILKLDAGQYYQEVWVQLKNKSWTLTELVQPIKNGRPLDVIPFFFVATRENNGEVVPPPIEDLVYINLSHYQNSADLENGAHIAGQPTPYVTGVESTQTEMSNGTASNVVLQLGSSTAWVISNPEAKVGFLQCGSEGFATLEKLMDRKEDQMAAMGARLLAPEKNQAEAAQTEAIRRGGESSVLSDNASAIEIPILKALKFAAEWHGVSGEVKFELNKDYLTVPMTAQEMTALVGAWQSGAISMKAMFDAMKAGKVYQESVTFEDEQDEKGLEGPIPGDV